MNASTTKRDLQAIQHTRKAHLPGVSVGAARDRAVQELEAVGFGVLAEIDLAETLSRRLDKKFSPYVVLEVCHPNLADRALSITKDAGMFLPCKVCVWQEGAGATVSFMSPKDMVNSLGFEALGPVAAEAEDQLVRALASISIEPQRS